MSKQTIAFMPGRAYPLGVFGNGDDLVVSARYNGRKDCGICLFSGKSRHLVLFDESCRTGNLYSAVLKGANNRFDSYLLYEDGTYFCDPYARKIIGLERFGVVVPPETLRCKSVLAPYDWRGDLRPLIPYEDSVIYCLNVRGFTKSASSGVPKALRGTFRGLIEKIPYLRSLGVTAVELMPVYEIQTARPRRPEGTPPAVYLENGAPKQEDDRPKINLWGYQEGFYFAPRASYAADKTSPSIECKDMIHAFHQAGMEVILQFYFAEGASKSLMVNCIRYWVSEYHIDGIHLKSRNIPVDMISSDPMLSDIKIMARDIGSWTTDSNEAPLYLADHGDTFAMRARRFLKGDDMSVNPFVDAMFTGESDNASVSYICNYDGFTLRDLVTYEHKQNSENGEGNNDGRNDNYGWNCGHEGETRKHAVRQLRRQQMLNALTMVFLSAHTPLIHAGDEMGNTQYGNNNPYCQDNKTGWTDWDRDGKYSAVTEYIRFLTGLRSTYPVIRCAGRSADAGGRNRKYPPLSFHGTDAWQPDFSDNSHSFGVLYSGTDAKGTPAFVYVIYNMYWNKTDFAMPDLPTGLSWQVIADTAREDPVCRKPEPVHEARICALVRSVRICVSVETETLFEKQKGKKKGTSRKHE